MKIKFRIALFLILIITLCKAGDIDFNNLFSKLNELESKNKVGSGSIKLLPVVTSCYIDPLMYPINYTANGYTCNKTMSEIELLKTENYNFLSKLPNPQTLDNIVFFDSVAKKLAVRELMFDKSFPFDYYDPLLFINTDKATQFIYEMKSYLYIRMPMEFFDPYDRNSKIDSIYTDIILSKWPIDTQKLVKITDALLQINDVRTLINRSIQYYDFLYKNNTHSETAKHRIDGLQYRISQMNDSIYYKIELLNNIALAYLNMGDRNHCYKTLLEALESIKYKEKKKGYIHDDDYNTIRLLTNLNYRPDVNNFFLEDRFSNILTAYHLNSTITPTTPVYNYNPRSTNRYDLKFNYNLLLKRGIVEFNKLYYYSVITDSIRNYGRIIITNQLIQYYQNSIKDSFIVDDDILADLFLVFSNYIGNFHPENEDLAFSLQLKGFIYSLDNFDYLQYQNRFLGLLNSLDYRKEYDKIQQLISSLDLLLDATNDHRLYSKLLLTLGDNYLKLNKADSAKYAYDRIKLNRDSINPSGHYYYNKALAELDMIKAEQTKDSIMFYRAKLFLKTNFDNPPVKEITELAKTESEYYLDKERREKYLIVQLQRDSLEIVNKKLKQTNAQLVAQTKLAQENEIEAKRQEGIAVAQRDLANNRLDTISLKEDSLRIERDSILKLNRQLIALNRQLIADMVLLHDKNIELGKAITNADTNKKWAYFLAAFATGVALLFFIALAYAFKNSNENIKTNKILKATNKELVNKNKELEYVTLKNLQAENARQKAEANLAHKLLTIHNFKGLETAKDDLYFHNNIKTDTIIEKCYNVLNSTFLYTQKILVNLEKSVVSLEDEFEAIKHYFTILKISKNKLYNLVLPEQTELLQYNDFKIIANIIQPIIENIIDYSGIEKCGNNGEDGLIKINILKQDKNLIKININDNGCGNTKDDRKNAKKSTGLSLKLLSELILKYTDNNKNIMIFDIDNDLQIQNGNTNINLKLLKYD